MDEEQLILLVEGYLFLYDQAHPKYSNQQIKENAWEEIVEKMKYDKKDCKSKWKVLRDSYRKSLFHRRTKSGQAAKKIKTWKFEREMSFIEKHVLTERNSKTNVKDVSVDNDPDEDMDGAEDIEKRGDGLENETSSLEEIDSQSNLNLSNNRPTQKIAAKKKETSTPLRLLAYFKSI